MTIVPAFQPIKHVGTGTFVAAEILARWNDRGRVLTAAQQPEPVDWGWVDIEVAKYIQTNPHCWEVYRSLFINVSEQTLCSDQHFQTWAGLITGLAMELPCQIVIEITEGIQDYTLAKRWDALVRLGGMFALDDFGDEHSTIDRLSQYNWHYCKFDAKRIVTLVDYPAFHYCRTKGINLVAEQIETGLQEDSAKLCGILMQQGYRHGKPMLLEACSHNLGALS